jgi:aminopeptidase N
MKLGRTQWIRVATALACLAAWCVPAAAQQRPRLRVDDYVIDADLTPATHHLNARTKVKFTALDDINGATFDLHSALHVTRVEDAAGKLLSAERSTQNSTVTIALPTTLSKGQSTTLTFDYDGNLQSGDDSPVPGLKLAYVGDDTSYLLYAGRWFPVSGYGTNRFTATISISAPANFTVIGSGKLSKAAATARPAAKAATAAPASGKSTWTYVWDKPSFPGTIIAGPFSEYTQNSGGVNLQVYFKPDKKNLASPYAEVAAKEFQFYSLTFGPAPAPNLKLVQLPDDTVPTAWAPEIAAIAGHAIAEKTEYRLLANCIAHQWFGTMVSPATRDDWWLGDGAARYAEAMYVQSAAGQAGFEETVKDMSVGALAYDNVPLSSVGRFDPFSPEFQSLTTDKGAMILHMLRWEIGDAAFQKSMRDFVTKNAWKSVTVDDLRAATEPNAGGARMAGFFNQWVDSTGAPEFRNKYTVLRTKNGFRVVGEISQDLDLFRMPVELKIDTDGKTEMRRIEVQGTNSPYSVETFGKPRRISIDPNNWVLKSSTDVKMRTAILRGQQLVQQGDLAEALKQFQTALDSNKNSSLAHYRIAEVFFMQRNYQAAANAYREALNGDGDPRWTEVWSHIQLGKIYDVTGQRERATNEYRQALQTNDDTQGALTEARRYLSQPYQRDKTKEGQ